MVNRETYEQYEIYTDIHKQPQKFIGFWVNHAVIRFEQGSLLDAIILAMKRDFDAAR